jgi:molybdopterin-containing oxidoreductase family membrane subunit
MLVMLIIYSVVRFYNLIRREALQYAFQPTYESTMFWMETGLGLLLPIALMLIPKIRENATRIYMVSILVISGFVLNRLNVASTGMEGFSGERYIPKWTEVSITLSVVAVGIFVFTMANKYLPIFTHSHATEPEEQPEPIAANPVPVPVR